MEGGGKLRAVVMWNVKGEHALGITPVEGNVKTGPFRIVTAGAQGARCGVP